METDFDELYAANYGSLTVQLYAYFGDRQEAQDVVQEAFCRALQRWKDVSTYDDPVAWVRRVAWNLATSGWRRRRTALAFLRRLHDVRLADEPGPDRVALVTALAALPAVQRRALVLHLRPPGTDAVRRTVGRRATIRAAAVAGCLVLAVGGVVLVAPQGGNGPAAPEYRRRSTPSAQPSIDVSDLKQLAREAKAGLRSNDRAGGPLMSGSGPVETPVKDVDESASASAYYFVVTCLGWGKIHVMISTEGQAVEADVACTATRPVPLDAVYVMPIFKPGTPPHSVKVYVDPYDSSLGRAAYAYEVRAY